MDDLTMISIMYMIMLSEEKVCDHVDKIGLRGRSRREGVFIGERGESGCLMMFFPGS